jgi:hypothetical protein
MIALIYKNRWAGLTLFLAIFATLIPHLITPGYYFDDDVRHYFMPSIHEIGNRLVLGEWSLLSLRTAYSGNLVGEGQFGLFNPVTLLIYALISQFQNLGISALIYVSIHQAGMALGVYALARQLKTPQHLACIAGIAFLCCGMNTYWYAQSWWNALTANTWLVWAAAAWLSLLSTGRHQIGAALTTVAVLTGGWPHGSVALAVMITLWWWLVLRKENWVSTTTRLCLTSLCALAISLPALVPLLMHVMEGQRRDMPILHNGILSATVDQLLALSWPSYLAAGNQYFGNRMSQPHIYAAWFILPWIFVYADLVLQRWKEAPLELRWLLYLACAFGFLSLGPELLGSLRWPFRFIAYFHLVLILGALKLWAEYAQKNLPLKRLALVWIAGFLLCWQQAPEATLLHLSFSLAGFGCSVIALRAKTPASQAASVLAGMLILFFLTHLQWPRNENVGHWPSPLLAQYVRESSPFRNTIILRERTTDFVGWEQQLPSGNIAAWENRRFINGYTPIAFRELTQRLCMNLWGFTCPKAVDELFKKNTATGTDLATLLKIDEIRTAPGAIQSKLALLASANGFSQTPLTPLNPYGIRWSRSLTDLPGSVSWLSPYVSVSDVSLAQPEMEEMLVANESETPGRVVWARLAYAGYQATLNSQPLEIEPLDGLLLSVVVPPNTAGKIVLKFRPYGDTYTYIAALIGFFTLPCFFLWQKRKREPTLYRR